MTSSTTTTCYSLADGPNIFDILLFNISMNVSDVSLVAFVLQTFHTLWFPKNVDMDVGQLAPVQKEKASHKHLLIHLPIGKNELTEKTMNPSRSTTTLFLYLTRPNSITLRDC